MENQNQSKSPLATTTGYCVRDHELRVVSQNDVTRKICGDCVGRACGTECPAWFFRRPDWSANLGVRVFESKRVGNDYFDVTVINQADRVTTIFLPLQAKHDASLAALKKYDLTPRQLEIASMIARGFGNSEIARTLEISKSTLKTHINNLYKKLPRYLVEELSRQAASSLSLT